MKKETVDEKNDENILDVLLDEENDSPITLYDEKDKAIKFEQVAIIPIDEKLYAILKPIDEMEGVAEDEALVFLIDEKSEKDSQLIVITDETIAMQVFDEYYKLLESIEGNKDEPKQDK
ncbi:MAG: DUF1292 domain-containing protein [Clostridia bacterium]|nr:DUF1292 domain-containing protein [Clostridia bacterium]